METIGFLELNSIAKGIETADTVLKTADVDLIFSKAGCPGKYYLLFTGEVAAVTAAIESAKVAAGDKGMLLDYSITPNPDPRLWEKIL